jgi:hypothetical protein
MVLVLGQGWVRLLDVFGFAEEVLAYGNATAGVTEIPRILHFGLAEMERIGRADSAVFAGVRGFNPAGIAEMLPVGGGPATGPAGIDFLGSSGGLLFCRSRFSALDW